MNVQFQGEVQSGDKLDLCPVQSVDEAYWKQQLAALPATHPLPLDYARPARLSTQRGNVQTKVGAAAAAGFVRLCRRQGATLAIGLHAALAVLIARHGQEQDVVIGLAVEDANLPGVSNILVLRTEIAPAASFIEVLALCGGVFLTAHAHRTLPFSRISELIGFESSADGSPAAQILLQVPAAPSLSPASHELRLAVSETDDGLSLDWSYAEGLFDHTSVERIAERFALLLGRIAARPECAIGLISLLSESERHQLLVEWNSTDAPYPWRWQIQDWFEAQVERTADAVALECRGESLTYDALNRRANRLAHHLRALGVDSNSLVGLCLERSLDLVVAMLAILKAGGAYVPLDPEYPAERQQFMLEDSQAGWVIVSAAQTGIAAVAGVRAVVLDDPETRELLNARSERNPSPLPGSGPEQLAYVIYTSGSTGIPKGVCIEHRNAVAFIAWAQASFRPEVLAGVLAATSVCFDLSIFEIFVPLCVGGRSIIVADALDFDGIAAARGLKLINTVPSAMKLLVEEQRVPDSVEVINLAGEALPRALVDAIYSGTSVRDVFNLYGPSEDTTYSTWSRVDRNDRRGPAIGRPISNGQVYVLDAERNPVPLGVVGEIYVAGAGVARGYWNRPELTRERFLPDPFSASSGSRMYRTGDLGRWRQDGELEYSGRMDQQIKLRGFRIELGEIDARLRQHPTTRDALVMAHEGANGDHQLAAYVVPTGVSDAFELINDLKRHLRERLPDYMIPAAFVLLEALPLTPNGKVDRNALPLPDGMSLSTPLHSRVASPSSEVERESPANPDQHVSASVPDVPAPMSPALQPATAGRVIAMSSAPAGANFDPPQTSIERSLAAIWQEVLRRRDPVGAGANFFDLGGHSLLATRMLSRVRKEHEVALPLKALFAAPVLRDFARLVGAQAKDNVPPLRPIRRDGPMPLSFSQQGLWFIDQLEEGSAHFNLQRHFVINSPVDEASLQRALDALVARHESLRTVYRADEDDEPMQVILPPAPAQLTTIDLRALDPRLQTKAVARYLGDDGEKTFRLDEDQLLRTTLLRLADDRNQLWLTVHHIAADGWSLGVLLDDLSELYLADKAGGAVQLPELPVQFADYAVWEQSGALDAHRETQLAYWKRQLADLPAVHGVPTDRPRPTQLGMSGAKLIHRLDRDMTDAFQQLCRQHDATLFMGLHAVFSILLAQHSGERDIVVGSPVANREHNELAGVVGCFVNMLVLRSDLDGSPRFVDLLRKSRQVVLDAMANQQIPFDALVRAIQPVRSTAYSPIFQIVLALQNTAATSLRIDGREAELLVSEESASGFELGLDITPDDAGLSLDWLFNTDLYEADSIRQLAEHFVRLVESVLQAPDAEVWSLTLLSDAERGTLLHDWNRTAADFPHDVTIHAQFEMRADATPDAIALIGVDRSLTYRELDQHADCVAAMLERGGVTPGGVVAILCERSPESIVGALAVLKVGCAFLPLDPGYPDARVQFILADAGATALLHGLDVETRLGDFQGVQISLHALLERTITSAEGRSVKSATIDPALPAYAIYTSGTTGSPKGVVISHIAVSNLCNWHMRSFELDASSRATHLASPGFDAAVWEVWPYLLHGAALVLVSDTDRATPAKLVGLLEQHRVTHCFMPTGLFDTMVEMGALGGTSLRYILVGGDRLSRHSLPNSSSARLFNFYGPTEAAVVATACEVFPSRSTPPIGRPIQNVQVYVLGSDLQLQPIGAVGELFVGGVGVASGYLGRPEFSAERFVASPFDTDGPGLLYRTGDRVRWRADGQLDFLGRIDAQIKIRGFRIEPAEIEAVIQSVDGVKGCLVLAREDVPGRKELVAYLVPSGAAGTALDLTSRVESALRRTVPEYMLPAAYVELEVFPLTVHGKIDRSALPRPSRSDVEDETAPASPIEHALARIWERLLEVTEIGATTNFFALGGNSLLVVRMIHAATAVLESELTIRDVFECPTIRALARRAEDTQGLMPKMGLTKTTTADEFALSPSQFRIWYLGQKRAGSSEHSIPIAMRLDGEVRVDVLQSVFDRLAARHDALRIRISLESGGPMQRVEADASLPLSFHDLRKLAPDDREREAGKLATAHARQPFDLESGPMMRALLLRTEVSVWMLHLNVHHIVFDGWSLARFCSEMLVEYDAMVSSAPSPLAALPFTYADYVNWQQHWLVSDAATRQAEFWNNYLEGCADRLALPGLANWVEHDEASDARVCMTLDESAVSHLDELARQHQTTLFSVLYGTFALLLARLSGQEDFNLGIPVNGRQAEGTQDLVGNFLNNLPVRNRVRLEEPFDQYLARQVRNLVQVLSHQDYPFEKILERVPHARKKDGTPLFQIFFNMASQPEVPAGCSDFALSAADAPEIEPKFELTLYVEQHDGAINFTAHFDRRSFGHTAISHLMKQYLGLLEQVGANSAHPCGAYTLRPSGLLESEAVRRPQRFWQGAVHDIVIRRAEQTPDAIAIQEPGRAWSYAELRAGVDALALDLQAAGAVPGGVVAIVAARRESLVRAMLAVLRTGAAFSLLNPEYPLERVELLAEIVQSNCILFAGERDQFSSELTTRLETRFACSFLSCGKVAVPSGDRFPEFPDVRPEHLACVTFTSGTTGRPKAVAGSHIGLSGYLGWVPQWLDIAASDRFSMVSGLGHDPIQRDVFSALCSGATIVIPPLDVIAPQALADWVRDERISFMHLTPAMARILVSAEDTPFDDLRVVFLTGEKLGREVVDALMALNPKMRVLNSYGATETQRAVTYLEASALPFGMGVVPIAEAAADTVVRVINSVGTACGVGELGDIHLESHHLSSGYRDDPDLTATLFSDLGDGCRRYRTGDVGCRMPGEVVMCLDRRDSQVNIRGFRIEPAEVEWHAQQLDEIAQATVVARRRPSDGELALVVYLVPSRRDADEAQLRNRLMERLSLALPVHMMPAASMVLDRLPLTPNGKLDRLALPEPLWIESAKYVAPASELEITLASVWSEVLRLDRVGVEDDFFELGGHSMLTALLLTQLRKRLGKRFDVRRVLACRTIREQAAVLG